MTQQKLNNQRSATTQTVLRMLTTLVCTSFAAQRLNSPPPAASRIAGHGAATPAPDTGGQQPVKAHGPGVRR